MNVKTKGPPMQREITAADLMNHDLVKPLIGKKRWSKKDKVDVGTVLKNRCFIDLRKLSPENSVAFSEFWSKVNKLCDSDLKFQELLDPSYIVVNFNGHVPSNYRTLLDKANCDIGGTVPIIGGPHVVGAASVLTEEPLRFVDPTSNNLSFLQVNNRENADHVAGALMVAGLSTWVLETKSPATYR